MRRVQSSRLKSVVDEVKGLVSPQGTQCDQPHQSIRTPIPTCVKSPQSSSQKLRTQAEQDTSHY